MAKMNPNFGSLSVRMLGAINVVARELQARKEAGVSFDRISGAVEFVVRISGTVVQGKATDVPRLADKDKLIRCLLAEMTWDQKEAAKARLKNRRRCNLKACIKDWLALVTPEGRIVRSGPLTGDLFAKVLERDAYPEPTDEQAYDDAMMKIVDAMTDEA